MAEDDDKPVPNEDPGPPPPEAEPSAPAGGRNVRRLASVRRVPPHDIDAEQALLSVVLTRPTDCWLAAAALESSAFYAPSHQHVHAAMAAVVAEGGTIDVVTVADRLRRMGLLDGLTLPGDHIRTSGTAALMELLALSWPHTGKADAYAQTIEKQARARRLLVALDSAQDAAWAGDLEGAMPAVERATSELTAAAVAGAARSWEPIDIAELLANGLTPVVPMQLAREDGECLLYPGKVHAFNAEPESGKSWLAMAACRETLAAGDHVLYLDFEADVESVLERMSALGAAPRALGERFHYVRPDDPFDVAARARLSEVLTTHNPALAVIDGVAEVMALNGWDENANADIAAFLNALPRLLERQGCTVVLIDHVVKDSKTRGRYARGGAHKLAGISGATYRLEAVRPFARGQVGMAKVIVTKDRPGWVRRLAVGDKVAEFELASSDDGESVTVTLRGPQSALGSDGEFRPTGYMERVSRELETASAPLSGSAVRRFVAGKKPVIDAALRCLVAEGYAAAEPGPRNAQLHRSVRPFREDAEAVENESEMDEEPF